MLLNLCIACFAFTASQFGVGVGEESKVQPILLRKETQREREREREA